ncbi:hypothetical protein NDU88_008801 [Pleurodeles waltl]|uniref:Uncharacterized protein n=1 Tax=Pleurodeles waltl TaxID=8319 RepID=A0AAV7RUA5_PLEWA|nr:hypothetical protein NDU88_008801 [Pleurodeles waltl]
MLAERRGPKAEESVSSPPTWVAYHPPCAGPVGDAMPRRGTKVIVRSDGTLSLDRRRREQEEARLLVQPVTAEVSPLSGSPHGDGGLTQD